MLPESFALIANSFRAAILVHHFFKIFYFLLPVIKLLFEFIILVLDTRRSHLILLWVIRAIGRF